MTTDDIARLLRRACTHTQDTDIQRGNRISPRVSYTRYIFNGEGEVGRVTSCTRVLTVSGTHDTAEVFIHGTRSPLTAVAFPKTYTAQ